MSRKGGTLESSIERVLGELRREYWRSIELAPADDPGAEQVLVLGCGSERFALHAAQAREVSRLGELVPLPAAPPRLAGVTSVRGLVVPVLDLRRVVEGVACELGPSSRLVTLRTEQPVSLLVEVVEDIVEVPLPELLVAAEAPPAETTPCRGSLTLPSGDEARLLDLARLSALATGGEA